MVSSNGLQVVFATQCVARACCVDRHHYQGKNSDNLADDLAICSVDRELRSKISSFQQMRLRACSLKNMLSTLLLMDERRTTMYESFKHSDLIALCTATKKN